MLKSVKTSVMILFVLLSCPALLWSQISAASEGSDTGVSDSEALEIIAKAEAKLYCPLNDGLEDLSFIYEGGIENVKHTYWFKIPDQVLGMISCPDLSVAKSKKPKITGNKVLEVEVKVADIMSRRAVYRVLGKPISCFIPFGKFTVISKGESGYQIRFTSNITNPIEAIWTNVDFFFDAEYRLTKIMEKTAGGEVTENRITLKPYKEGADLLVMDEVVALAGTKVQNVSTSKLNYVQKGSFYLLESIDLENKKESKKFTLYYLDYKINQGLDDSLFKR